MKISERARRLWAPVDGGLERADGLLRRALGWPVPDWGLIGGWLLATALFYFLIRNIGYKWIQELPEPRLWLYRGMSLLYVGLFSATLAGVVRLLRRERARLWLYVAVAVIWGALLLLRLALREHKSDDYLVFLARWADGMRPYGFAEAMHAYHGDYNAPYAYLVFLISRSGIPDLYLYKFISIVGDYLAAYFVMKLVALRYRQLAPRLAALILTLLVPTVLLNGAYWAQCDVLYTAFALGGLYYVLAEKPARGVACFAIALSWKLQAIFMLPLLAVLYGMGKVRLKHLLLYPLVFLATLLPAMLAGRSLGSLLLVYQNQTSVYDALTMNAPSIYHWLPQVNATMFSSFGIYLALAATVAVCALLFSRARTLSSDQVITAAFLLALMMPLLLPHMHERYFFLADVLGVAYALYYPKRWYIPAAVVVASLNGYWVWLSAVTLIPQQYTALALVAAVIMLGRQLYRQRSVAGQQRIGDEK